jgi:hypothetical protein
VWRSFENKRTSSSEGSQSGEPMPADAPGRRGTTADIHAGERLPARLHRTSPGTYSCLGVKGSRVRIPPSRRKSEASSDYWSLHPGCLTGGESLAVRRLRDCRVGVSGRRVTRQRDELGGKMRSMTSAPSIMTSRICWRYTVSVTSVLVSPTSRAILSIGIPSPESSEARLWLIFPGRPLLGHEPCRRYDSAESSPDIMSIQFRTALRDEQRCKHSRFTRCARMAGDPKARRGR